MSTMVAELYRALRQAGVDEATAEAAARAVWQPELPATKTDIANLRTELAQMKAELVKWNVGTLVAMTALFTAIVGWMAR